MGLGRTTRSDARTHLVPQLRVQNGLLQQLPCTQHGRPRGCAWGVFVFGTWEWQGTGEGGGEGLGSGRGSPPEQALPQVLWTPGPP